MRMTRFLNIAVLSALVAASVALYAQDDKPQEPKPPRQEEPRTEPKQKEEMKAPKQDQMKPAQQGDMKPEKQEEAKPARQQQEEAKPSKDEQKAQKEQQKQQEKQAKEQMKQDKNHTTAAAAQNNEASRGGAVGHPKGKSGHIPDDRFKSHFGQSHKFVVQRTTVVQGQPGFVYGGYSFVFIDPWPAEWAYTDDCYVDYIDGEYFLFDLLHPGIRIALFVAL